MDAAGPGRQASRACPPVRHPATAEVGGRPAPQAAARDPLAPVPPRLPGHIARPDAPAGGSPDLAAVATVVTRPLTLEEIAGLPAVTDLVTAGRALGLGRTKAYDLARAGQFPCPVIRAGKDWLVPTAGLLALLGLPVPGTRSIRRRPGPGLPAAPRQCRGNR